MNVLLVFVDGLGLGPEDPAINPLHRGCCPTLERLLRVQAVPVDAGLGVAGDPQSATGQTALLTGLNAAAFVGRHVEGFPGPALRALIREHNLFSRLARIGRRAAFANAYYARDTAEVRAWRRQSVTTVAALSAFGAVRTAADLERGAAVYHDLTRAALRERGYTGPLLTPAQAAAHLLALSAAYDLTLFEYFQTDRAGHAGESSAVERVLAQLDEFLAQLIEGVQAGGTLLALVSDHGNIEDATRRGHTRNPVPLAAVGPAASALLGRVKTLTDVTPALLDLWRSPRPPET